MNVVTLVGRLTADPELKYLPTSNVAVCNYALAVDKELSSEKRREFEAKGKHTADFINIATFGKAAESVANHMRKGCLMGVSGRLQVRSWKDDSGNNRYIAEVITNKTDFLSWPKKESQANPETDQQFSAYESDDIPF